MGPYNLGLTHCVCPGPPMPLLLPCPSLDGPQRRALDLPDMHILNLFTVVGLVAAQGDPMTITATDCGASAGPCMPSQPTTHVGCRHMCGAVALSPVPLASPTGAGNTIIRMDTITFDPAKCLFRRPPLPPHLLLPAAAVCVPTNGHHRPQVHYRRERDHVPQLRRQCCHQRRCALKEALAPANPACLCCMMSAWGCCLPVGAICLFSNLRDIHLHCHP